LLVEITEGEIVELKKVSEKEREEVLKCKEVHQQLWRVKSYKEGRKLLEKHNETIKKDTVKKDLQVTRNAQIKLWDWDKTNKRVKNKLKRLYKNQSWKDIMIIHNNLKLTSENYCCDGYISKIKYNIDKALEDGTL
jgi:hypothetical protein